MTNLADGLFSVYDLRPTDTDPRAALAADGTVFDLFAGPGGWDEGLRLLGYIGPLVGIEWESGACATAEAAGHLRLQADVATTDLAGLGSPAGLIASPPCPSFSMSGARQGTHDLPLVAERVRAFAEGQPAPGAAWADHRSLLTAEPMRWAAHLQPPWIACEQVPAVLPVWELIGEQLRHLGYSVWTGLVNAADYGVPQIRKRAVLLASREHPVAAPARTHHETGDGGLPAWATMSDALGWGMTSRPYFTLAAANNSGGPDKEKVGGSASRAALYRERDAGRWITPPPEPRFADGSIRVTLSECARLMGFRDSYPWCGNESTRFQQVSNAVPPPLAAACLRAVLPLDF